MTQEETDDDAEQTAAIVQQQIQQEQVQSPPCIKVTLSLANVEKVVKAPKNPAPTSRRKAAATARFWR